MKIFFCLLAICTCNLLNAQNNTKHSDTTKHVTVFYNFLSIDDPLKILRASKKSKDQNGKYTSVLLDVRKIYYGDKVNFKVQVNPFLYDVKVTGSDIFDNIAFDTTGQSSLLNFFSAWSEKQRQDSGSSAVPEINDQTQPVATKNPVKETTIAEIYNIAGGIKNNNPALKDDKVLKEAEKVANENAVNATASVLDASTAFVKNNTDALPDSAQRKYKRLLFSLKQREISLNEAVAKYEYEEDVLQNILTMSFADYQEYDSIIKGINCFLAYSFKRDTALAGIHLYNLDSLKNSLQFVLNGYRKTIALEVIRTENIYVDMKNLNELFAIKTFSHDSTIYAANKNHANSILSENLGDFSRAYIVFLQNLSNKNLFEKSYPPQFAAADSFRFQIALSPSSRARNVLSAYKIPVRDTTVGPYTIPVKHFLKLNFSTGLSFLFGNAIPYSYYFSNPKDQLEDTDIVSIKKGKGLSSLVPKIAFFTHLYLTNGQWAKPALTVGLSTNPADLTETAYMLGGSLILGHHRRMVLTAGMALANVDRIKSRYKDLIDIDKKKKFFEGVDETALVEKRLSLGGFFGLSYNF